MRGGRTGARHVRVVSQRTRPFRVGVRNTGIARVEVVMIVRSLALSVVALVVFACGSPAAAPSPSPATATPTAAAATATLTPEPGALVFQVETGSKAVVRVREQLASFPAPNDAVLETTDVQGAFGLRADGTFTPESKITAGLQALRSDSGQRDSFVKSETLDTRRFPTADFIPVRATGLPTPLPATGEWTFQVVGKMSIKGVEREVTWDVKAKRDATGITASAKNAPSWKFGDFSLTVPRVASVLSIVDELRLELELIAREGR